MSNPFLEFNEITPLPETSQFFKLPKHYQVRRSIIRFYRFKNNVPYALTCAYDVAAECELIEIPNLATHYTCELENNSTQTIKELMAENQKLLQINEDLRVLIRQRNEKINILKMKLEAYNDLPPWAKTSIRRK